MPDDLQLDSLKLPPHSLEAEQSVLGGLLLDNEAADRVGDVAGAADFYSDAHRVIYRHVMQLIADGKPADVVTLAESLSSAQKLDYVGGLAYLGALVQNVPTAANIRHYAQIVRDRSILRQLAATAGEIAEAAYNPLGRNAKAVLDEAKVMKDPHPNVGTASATLSQREQAEEESDRGGRAETGGRRVAADRVGRSVRLKARVPSVRRS